MTKKLLSIFLTLLMLFSLSVPFVSAQDTVVAEIGSKDADEARNQLGALLNSAVEILTSPDIGQYPADACEALENAIGEGFNVYYNPDASAEELNAQAEKVSEALSNMKKQGVSEEAVYYLSSVIVEAETKLGSENNYTSDSWSAFVSILEIAKQVRDRGVSDGEFIEAADALRDAMNALESVDPAVSIAREYLRVTINSAYQMLSGDERYTEDSLKMLEDAIEKAESVYNNTDATVQELYLEADILANVMNYMEVITISPEVAALLSNAIDYADFRVGAENDYTPDSWSKYINAYSEAVRVLNTGKTDDEYISAANALDTAIKNLVPVDTGVIAAREDLLAVINSAYQLLNGSEKYTSESIELLQSVLDNASSVISKEDADEQELRAEIEKIESAIALMKKIEISNQAKEILQSAIKSADNQVSTEYEYTPESWSAFINAYSNATKVLELGESDEEFISAANALETAVKALVKSNAGVDAARGMLSEAINNARQMLNSGERYTKESVKNLEEAIDSADKILAEESKTEQELYAEIYSLESAINSMEKVVISAEAYNNLFLAISRAEEFRSSEDKYTTESFKAFSDAYTEAVNVLENGESDEEFIAAADALNSATEGLEAVVIPTVSAKVKAALMAAIISAKTEVDLSKNYTAESLKEFNDAKDLALDVYNNSKSEEEFISATEKLLEAIANLKLATITVLLGDVDGDGKITIKDATLVQKIVAGIENHKGNSEYAADANRDDNVNVRDATEIQKHIASIKSCEDIGKEIEISVEKEADSEDNSQNSDASQELPDIYDIEFTNNYDFRVGPYNGNWDDANIIVRSPEELLAEIDKIDVDAYERNEDIYPEKYDDAFFEENVIIMSFCVAGGSGCSQYVHTLTVDGTALIIRRSIHRPDLYPPDMNYRLSYLEVKKSDIERITMIINEINGEFVGSSQL